jgi:hypothetical protein
MGYSTAVTQESGSASWVVAVRVSLSRAESNQLFLSGDSMLSWPTEGMEASGSGDPRLERSSIFVSEVAARPSGLEIRYSGQAQAERASALIRMQLAQIGINEDK